MSANSNYTDSSPVLLLIAFPQLDRALKSAASGCAVPEKLPVRVGNPATLVLGKRPRRRGCGPQSNHESGTHHFGSLEPLGTLGNFEPDLLTLIE